MAPATPAAADAAAPQVTIKTTAEGTLQPKSRGEGVISSGRLVAKAQHTLRDVLQFDDAEIGSSGALGAAPVSVAK